jgi:hypothetical protein
LRPGRHFLIDATKAHARWQADFTAFRRNLTADQLEQRGFA